MFGIGHGFRWLQPFYDDEGGGGGAGDVVNLPPVPAPSDADIDALGGDEDEDADIDDDAEPEGDEDEGAIDEDKEKPAKAERKPKTDDEKPDIDEGEGDEEEKPEEKPEEVDKDVKDEPASIRALKKDYPDIFKKHPQVRVAIAEHRKFKNIYPTVNEAQEALEAQTDLADLRESILDKADFGFLLDEVNKADGAAAARLVRKMLPAVLERSKDLYLEITEAPITQFVHAAYARAIRENNSNLKNSALYMWKFLGKDGNPAPTAAGPTKEDQQFEQRVQEFENKKLTDAGTVVNRDIRTGLVGIIEQAIDPKGSLRETTKKAIIAQLVRDIDAEVASDQNHMTRVNRLWANARRSSYAQGHISRITSAYLERAKQLLPKHARKVREELNISDDRQTDDKKPQGERITRQPAQKRSTEPAPRPTGGGSASPRTIRDTNPRSIDWNRTSDEDILSGKARLRR